MSDVKDAQPQSEGVKDPVPPQGDKPESIPYARFKEINDKLKQYEEREAKRTEEEKAAKEKKLMDEKKYQELLDQKAKELDDVKKEAQKAAEIAHRYQEQQEKIRGEALGKIHDEELRALAEKFSDPADVLAFVNKIESQRGAPSGGKLPPPEKEGNPFERRPGETMADFTRRVDLQIANRNRSK